MGSSLGGGVYFRGYTGSWIGWEGDGNPKYHFVKEERGNASLAKKRWLITKQENVILITPISPSQRRVVKIHKCPVNQITSIKRRFHVAFATLTWIYRRILSCLTSYRLGIALCVALLQRRIRKRCIDVVLNIVMTSFLKFSNL